MTKMDQYEYIKVKIFCMKELGEKIKQLEKKKGICHPDNKGLIYLTYSKHLKIT